jgi:hypothetical protein
VKKGDHLAASLEGRNVGVQVDAIQAFEVQHDMPVQNFIDVADRCHAAHPQQNSPKPSLHFTFATGRGTRRSEAGLISRLRKNSVPTPRHTTCCGRNLSPHTTCCGSQTRRGLFPQPARQYPVTVPFGTFQSNHTVNGEAVHTNFYWRGWLETCRLLAGLAWHRSPAPVAAHAVGGCAGCPAAHGRC